MSPSVIHRVLGGSPLTVSVRLLVVSLLVGALMTWLGIDAADLLAELQLGFERLYGTGFAALSNVGRTIMAGAAVVVPIWVVARLLSYRSPRARGGLDDPGRATPIDARWTDPERRP